MFVSLKEIKEELHEDLVTQILRMVPTEIKVQDSKDMKRLAQNAWDALDGPAQSKLATLAEAYRLDHIGVKKSLETYEKDYANRTLWLSTSAVDDDALLCFDEMMIEFDAESVLKLFDVLYENEAALCGEFSFGEASHNVLSGGILYVSED